MTRSLFGKSSECDKGANASLCGPPASLLSRKPQPWAFLLGSRSYLAIWIPSYLSLAWRMPGPTCCVWPPSSSLSFSIFAIVVVLSGQCSPASPHCSPGSADRHLLHLVFIEGLTYQCSVCAEPHKRLPSTSSGKTNPVAFFPAPSALLGCLSPTPSWSTGRGSWDDICKIPESSSFY